MSEEMKEKVTRIANNALYFDDSSDYATALWEILSAVQPEWFADDAEPDLVYITD